VFGNDATIAFAGSQGTLELNAYQPLIAANLLGSIHLIARACTLFAELCVNGIEADVERCAFYASATPALATRLNTELGYDHVAAIVKTATTEHRALLDVVVDDGTLTPVRAAALLNATDAARGNRRIVEPRQWS
jgi:fumarate hydratase class II